MSTLKPEEKQEHIMPIVCCVFVVFCSLWFVVVLFFPRAASHVTCHKDGSNTFVLLLTCCHCGAIFLLFSCCHCCAIFCFCHAIIAVLFFAFVMLSLRCYLFCFCRAVTAVLFFCFCHLWDRMLHWCLILWTHELRCVQTSIARSNVTWVSFHADSWTEINTNQYCEIECYMGFFSRGPSDGCVCKFYSCVNTTEATVSESEHSLLWQCN